MARKAKPPAERRLEMVEAARRLFYSRGFAKTTISEIIEDVEVSKGLFYYYFGSKEEILDEIVNQLVAEDVAALEVIAAQADLQPGEAIVMMLAMHRSLVAAGGDIAVQLRGINNPEIVIKTVRQVATRLSPIFAEVVQRGAAASQFRVEDPRECIRILLSAFTFDAVFGAGAQRVDHDAAFLQILERSLGAAPGGLPGFRT